MCVPKVTLVSSKAQFFHIAAGLVCLSVCLSVTDLKDGRLLVIQRDTNLNRTTI